MTSLIRVSRNLWRISVIVKNNMTSFSLTRDTQELQKIAHELRKDVLDMLRLAGSGHIG